MFVRIRWFILGFLTAAIVGAMIVKRARAMKERLDAEGVARVAASYIADAVESMGHAMQRSAQGPLQQAGDPEGSGPVKP